MSEVTTPRFVSLNIIGAAVWATTFGLSATASATPSSSCWVP